ncbi:TetR/AcrR family transcriptional regulator [uncultured Hoeflea sp.]|uniref:TetR/AcrR family transcriptional regulator n=1 Tax=uncultured Hoeflea sp. TaxID=538666 RepID=UPI002611493B|nr:TetR/AcrR family transcriptional regulator [uncultured Hoeflea sp.]
MDTAANKRVCDILEKVKSTFAFNGFDGASMQDLAQAAQMSVGNFYRYFPSKNAIITALVERDLGEIEAVFETVRAASDPGPVFMELLKRRIETLPVEDAALWTEVQAAAFRSPEIGALMCSMEETVRRNVVGALIRIHADDSESAIEDYTTRAHFLMILVHGFAEQKFCARNTASPGQISALSELVLATLRKTIFTPPVSASQRPD